MTRSAKNPNQNPRMSLATKKKMKIPNISLLVVMKGPVATAGSMPFLSRIRGTKVPIREAIMMTMISEMEMVMLMSL